MPQLPEVVLFKSLPMKKNDGEYIRRVKIKPETLLNYIEGDCYLTLIYIDPRPRKILDKIDTFVHEFVHFLQMKFDFKFWNKPEEDMAYLSGRTVKSIFETFREFHSPTRKRPPKK